jgi:hypothetical protein
MYKSNSIYKMIVQSRLYAFDETMAFYEFIYDGRLNFAYSKTIEIEEKFFSEAFQTLTSSLTKLFKVGITSWMDGGRLIVSMKGDAGHECTLDLTSPVFEKNDAYGTNALYRSFLEVLDIAGLMEWYDDKLPNMGDAP